jgi:hypothetical protein
MDLYFLSSWDYRYIPPCQATTNFYTDNYAVFLYKCTSYLDIVECPASSATWEAEVGQSLDLWSSKSA